MIRIRCIQNTLNIIRIRDIQVEKKMKIFQLLYGQRAMS